MAGCSTLLLLLLSDALHDVLDQITCRGLFPTANIFQTLFAFQYACRLSFGRLVLQSLGLFFFALLGKFHFFFLSDVAEGAFSILDRERLGFLFGSL